MKLTSAAAIQVIRPPKAVPNQLRDLVRAAVDMQSLRHDTKIPESTKAKMLERMREQTKFIEDQVNRQAEEQKKSAMVESASDASAAVAQAATQERAGATDPAPSGGPSASPQDAAQADAPKPVAASISAQAPTQAVGSMLDTYA